MHLTSLYVPTTWEIYLLSFPDMIRFGMSYVLFLEISTCVLGCWGRGEVSVKSHEQFSCVFDRLHVFC